MNPDKVFLKNRLHEYLAKMSDATYEELAELKKWVCKGNDPYDNPFWVCDESGSPMDFISAYRFEKEINEQYCPDKVSDFR